MKIDLHLHTTYSDGIYSPETVIKLARDNGLDAISLTDHDTVGAYQELEGVETGGLKIIRGAEITANHEGNEIHILGYFKEDLGGDLQDFLNNTQAERIRRIKEGLSNLRKHNINLSYDELNEFNKGESVGRNHLANLLVAKGYAASVKESFLLYLKDELNIIPQLLTPVKEVIEVIHRNQGVAVWAHPPHRFFEKFLPDFKEWGLDGIEAFNYRKTTAFAHYYADTALKNNLLISAGSDWHGFEGETFPDKVFYREEITDKFINLFD
ncbi:MAG: PHP domain-containing protein [Planctomycetota bacterium]